MSDLVMNLESRLLLLLLEFFREAAVCDLFVATVFEVVCLKLEDEKCETEVVVIFF